MTVPRTGNGINLTTAWGIAGGWEHFWTPSLRTSIHGSYVTVRYNAQANAQLCGSQTAGGTGAQHAQLRCARRGPATRTGATWQVGARTQWNVTKDFYMGVDLAYYKLQTASAGAVVNYTALAGGAQPTGLRTVADQDASLAASAGTATCRSRHVDQVTIKTPGGKPPGVLFWPGISAKYASRTEVCVSNTFPRRWQRLVLLEWTVRGYPAICWDFGAGQQSGPSKAPPSGKPVAMRAPAVSFTPAGGFLSR